MNINLRHSGRGFFIINNSIGGGVDEMKSYSKNSVTLVAGDDTSIVTTIPATGEIYSVEFFTSGNVIITTGLGHPVISISGGVWVITVYSEEELTNIILRVIYK